MNKPFFSVCIPTYNRGHMLPAAIESVLAQDYDDYELVIVDNASTDNTQEILNSYSDPRIRIIRNLETVSMYANHNLCVNHAQADWIVFLHSDDSFNINCLAILYRYSLINDCDIIYPGKEIFLNNVNNNSLILDGKKALPSILRCPTGPPSGAAYKKTILLKYPFNEISVVSDFLLISEVLNNNKIVKIINCRTVNAGIGEFQYSNKWHKSGKFIEDVSRAYGEILNYDGVKNMVLDEICNWSAGEIGFFLLMICHANERIFLEKIELCLNCNAEYKNTKHYYHVYCYKYFGLVGLKIIFKAVKCIKSLFR